MPPGLLWPRQHAACCLETLSTICICCLLRPKCCLLLCDLPRCLPPFSPQRSSLSPLPLFLPLRLALSATFFSVWLPTRTSHLLYATVHKHASAHDHGHSPHALPHADALGRCRSCIGDGHPCAHGELHRFRSDDRATHTDSSCSSPPRVGPETSCPYACQEEPGSALWETCAAAPKIDDGLNRAFEQLSGSCWHKDKRVF